MLCCPRKDASTTTKNVHRARSSLTHLPLELARTSTTSSKKFSLPCSPAAQLPQSRQQIFSPSSRARQPARADGCVPPHVLQVVSETLGTEPRQSRPADARLLSGLSRAARRSGFRQSRNLARRPCSTGYVVTRRPDLRRPALPAWNFWYGYPRRRAIAGLSPLLRLLLPDLYELYDVFGFV